ncbi:MAG: hypothetical protein K8L99_19580 [Anaerolineae bacterium]|nr:hypothetical protein [Anaerolineae bacterium]
MKASHPRSGQNRLLHYGAAVLVVIMLIAALFQVVLALLIQPGMLFLLTAILTLALVPFVLSLTTATPAVSIAREGLTVEPVVWKNCFVPWDGVAAIKPYPLLPQASAETTRRAMVGRKKYRAAEGIMLVIPSLPLQYRIIGVLAGEGWTPVIALTNRTHQDYDTLVNRIKSYSAGKASIDLS